MNFLLVQIFFFLIQFKIELNENINSNKDNKIKKEEKSEINILNDNNFDSLVKNGKDNRWLIIFFIESCYHCERAIQVLKNILYKNQFSSVNNIKFGQIDISKNSKTNFRFNITEVPYIILIENNSMIELIDYPNERNFLNFMESNFSKWRNIFPMPKIGLFRYYYIYFKNSLDFLVDKINDLLKSNNINYDINPIVFIILYIIFCIIVWTILIKGYIKICDRKKKEDTNNLINKNDNSENKDIKSIKDEEKNINYSKKYHYSRRRKSKKN